MSENRNNTDKGLRISVNGETVEVQEGSTVADLLVTVGATKGPVAVECNCEVIPKAQHGHHRVREGDKIEVVSFVGGG